MGEKESLKEIIKLQQSEIDSLEDSLRDWRLVAIFLIVISISLIISGCVVVAKLFG